LKFKTNKTKNKQKKQIGRMSGDKYKQFDNNDQDLPSIVS